MFRRRKVLLPTLAGWLVILFLLTLCFVFVARNLAVFLAVDEPAGGDYLVIEGWMHKDELDQAKEYFDSHGYARAIVVGGPITNDFHGLDKNYAERAGIYLQSRGLAAERLAVVAYDL